jgi:type VI secretion system protein ImpF
VAGTVQKNILPSVFDRLIDDAPEAARDPTRSRAQQLTALRDAVRRDLEALLNTHCCCVSPPEEFEELQQSVVEYGVRDFLSGFGAASTFREEFRSSMEQAIRRFEPRFVTVEVKLRDEDDQTDRTLRFRIDALLYAEPSPELVSFDSQLDPVSQTHSVKARSDV